MQVQLDPYVALSILDHHQRRGVDQTRAEGVLLGSTVKNTIQIRGYVPSLANRFFQCITRLSPKDLVVGWYVTEVGSDDAKLEAETLQKATPKPLYLTVEMPSEENGMELTFRCFQAQRAALADETLVTVHKELPIVYGSTDPASAVIIDTIVRQEFPELAGSSDPCAIPATVDGDDKVAHLRNISNNLKIARQYVDGVVSGKIAGDKALGRALFEVLDNLQSISENTKKNAAAAAAEAAAANEEEQQAVVANDETTTNDALVLQYVAKLLKVQINAIEKHAARPKE